MKSNNTTNSPLTNLLLTILIVLGIYCFIVEYLARNQITSGLLLSTSIIVVLGVLMVRFVLKSGLPLKIFGLNLYNWKRAVKESITWSVCFIGIAILIKYLYLESDDSMEMSLLSFDVFYILGYKKSILFLLVYVIISPIQEFISRCVIQGSLQLHFGEKYGGAKAILFTSVLFSLFHLIVNPYFAYATFIPSVFWGILYKRNPSLLSVSLSHIILGVFFFYFDYFPITDLVKL